MWSMFEIIQKLAPAPPTGLYNFVAPLRVNNEIGVKLLHEIAFITA